MINDDWQYTTIDSRALKAFRYWATAVGSDYFFCALDSFMDDSGDIILALTYPELCEAVVDDMVGSWQRWLEAGTDGHIYVLRAGEFYKIGRTRQLDSRIKALSIQLPFPVEVVHTFPSDDHVEVEQWIHDLFADKRANGEWFRLSEEDVARIRKWERIDLHDLVAEGWLESMPFPPNNTLRKRVLSEQGATQ